MKWLLIVVMILAALVAASRTPASPLTPKQPDMPNPASKHCADEGGKLEIRDESRGQVGYCTFSDGSKSEEWANLGSERAQTASKRIRFEPGATSAIELGSLAAGGIAHYMLGAIAEQTMSVAISSSQGNVILTISGTNGTVLISDHAGTTHWSGQLPVTQDYKIDAISVGDTAANYTL
ncbi:MAG: DUF333 domain-containing protein [Chloroflexi bacterium]|nr:DUF333 domain-containing protein [Chloroflexota bacterium]